MKLQPTKKDLMFQQNFDKSKWIYTQLRKRIKTSTSINHAKDKINVLEERQKHWLVKLNEYDKNIQQFVKTFNLPNNDQESMIAKYRCQVKENEATNVNNWYWHFIKFKETRLEKHDSHEIDNLLKYAVNTTAHENRQIHRNYCRNDQQPRRWNLPTILVIIFWNVTMF